MEKLYKTINRVRIFFLVTITLGVVILFTGLGYIFVNFDPKTLIDNMSLTKFLVFDMIVTFLLYVVFDVLSKKVLSKSDIDLINSDSEVEAFKPYFLDVAPYEMDMTYKNFRRAYSNFKANIVTSSQARRQFHQDLSSSKSND